MLHKEIAAWQASRQSASVIAKEISQLERSQRQQQLQIERLLDAYQRGAIDVEQLKARRERLDATTQGLRHRTEDLISQQQDSSRLNQIADDIAAFAATLHHGLDSLDFAGRQRLARLLLERVVVTGDRLTIEHAIPLSGRFSGLRQGDRVGLQGLEVQRQPACVRNGATRDRRRIYLGFPLRGVPQASTCTLGSTSIA
jgi:hypothetical protein